MDLSPEDLLPQIKAGTAPVILDVRSALEFSAGHLPGAVHLPFWSALFRAGRIAARRDDPVVVYCGHGPRARMAARALRLRGFRDVRLLWGHLAGWRDAGLPLER
jgi:rhodanese-related sulfurtransferase